MAHIVVTGSSGMLGTRLCERLLEQGHQVVGVDRKPNRWNRKLSHLTIRGDLCFPRVFEKLPTDAGVVVHLAANSRVLDTVHNPDLARENLVSTFNVLEFCRRHRTKRFLFSSSREVYGETRGKTSREEDVSVIHIKNGYAASKLAGEALIHAYRQCYGLNSVIVRLSNVYGMYDLSDRVVPCFLRRMLKAQDVVVYGRDKLLDLVHIDDAIEALLSCLRQFPAAKNTVLNIGSGTSTSMETLVRCLQEKLQVSSRIVYRKKRDGEVDCFVADISRLRRLLGYRPRVNLDEGIERAIAWYSQAPPFRASLAER